MKLTSKLPQVGTTIFTVMSQLAVDHGAVNLGQGFPDFDPDPELIRLVHQAMLDGHNQYPSMMGVPSLRQAIVEKIEALYGHRYDPATEITVTSGATEALMISIQALVHPGDEVIVIEPVYDLYLPAIELAGGKPVVVPMLAPDRDHPRYRVDWQRVSDAINDKTRLLILNFPHNPTGIVLSENELDFLEDLVERTGVMILSDEVYEHIVFDGRRHESLARREKLAAHAVVVSSFGKTYHTTGWKLGYCAAPAAITREIQKVHQFTVFTVSSPMQHGLAQFMRNPETYLNLASFYQARRDYLFDGLAAQTRFKPLSSEGTFFLLADYRDISDEAELAFARRLTTEHGVTAIPMAAFYAQPNAPESNHCLIRLCFAKQNATLDRALERFALV